MKSLFLLGVLGMLTWAVGCKSTTHSPVPHIDQQTIAPDSIHAGFYEDTVHLYFHFTDGDADLGTTDGKYVFIKRNVDTQQAVFAIPQISSALRDPVYGMEGTAIINLPAAYPILYPREDSFHLKHGDTVTLEFFIKDQAGNESNHLTTLPIIVRP